MSDLYTELNDQSTLIAKGHKARACAVCQYPIDELPATIDLGSGLEVQVHKACKHDVMEAMAPKAETIPVAPMRKATVATDTYVPFEQKRTAELIKQEMYQLLLNEGLRQAHR